MDLCLCACVRRRVYLQRRRKENKLWSAHQFNFRFSDVSLELPHLIIWYYLLLRCVHKLRRRRESERENERENEEREREMRCHYSNSDLPLCSRIISDILLSEARIEYWDCLPINIHPTTAKYTYKQMCPSCIPCACILGAFIRRCVHIHIIWQRQNSICDSAKCFCCTRRNVFEFSAGKYKLHGTRMSWLSSAALSACKCWAGKINFLPCQIYSLLTAARSDLAYSLCCTTWICLC